MREFRSLSDNNSRNFEWSPIIDAVIPARDEATTVAANVAAVRACRFVREVIVVDDGSSDATAERAREAGAKVINRTGAGSKAHAMAEGVAATDAEAIFFVDADCTGLTGAHLDAIGTPFVEGRAAMSLGAFDYGPFWNPMVLRWPPLSGERIIPRWVFESIPPDRLDGYTIEVRINEVIAEGRFPTVVRTMGGVYHRTKRDKLGRRPGLAATWAMYRELLALLLPGRVRWRTYWFYLRGLTVER
ncbi:glycosyltransferase family 2 protein [soil metagenome]